MQRNGIIMDKIFGSTKNEVSQKYRTFQYEELKSCVGSPSKGRKMKCRRVRCAGHLVWVRKTRNAYRILWKSTLQNDHFRDWGDGRIILTCILGRYFVTMGGEWNCLRILSSGVLCYQRCRTFGVCYQRLSYLIRFLLSIVRCLVVSKVGLEVDII
jgi:hypothetical protein